MYVRTRIGYPAKKFSSTAAKSHSNMSKSKSISPSRTVLSANCP